jgi:hypothetical protein
MAVERQGSSWFGEGYEWALYVTAADAPVMELRLGEPRAEENPRTGSLQKYPLYLTSWNPLSVVTLSKVFLF